MFFLQDLQPIAHSFSILKVSVVVYTPLTSNYFNSETQAKLRNSKHLNTYHNNSSTTKSQFPLNIRSNSTSYKLGHPNFPPLTRATIQLTSWRESIYTKKDISTKGKSMYICLKDYPLGRHYSKPFLSLSFSRSPLLCKQRLQVTAICKTIELHSFGRHGWIPSLAECHQSFY